MDNELLDIKTAETKSLKDRVKINLGRACSYVFGRRCQQLLQSPTCNAASWKDKMLMAYLKERARTSGNVEFFERLHVDFWQGEGGEVFSSNCDHRFEDLFLKQQAEDFQLLKKFWSEGDYKNIVEIGCCAGLHLQHLTTNLPGVESAIGIDINPLQIQTNQTNPKFDSRIQFLVANGAQWVLSNGKPKTLFVTNGGVFEYFSKQRLVDLFRHVAENLGPSMFFTVEPVASDYDFEKRTESIPFGEELSFCHNYRHLYESTGFDVIHQRPVDFESWRMMTMIAVVNDATGNLPFNR